MRKSGIIKIDTDEFTVKELRARDIYELFSEFRKERKSTPPVAGEGEESGEAQTGEGIMILAKLEDFLGRCSDMTLDQFLDMAPSEIEEAWKVFAEVNKAFLGMTRRFGLDKMLKTFLQTFQTSLQDALLFLPKMDMDQVLGTTDGESS